MPQPPPPPPPQRSLPSPGAAPAPAVSPGDEKSIAAKDDAAGSEVKASLPLPFPGLGGLDLPGEAGAQMSKLYQDELAKIMQQQQKALAAASPGGAGPAALFPGLGSLFGRPDLGPEGGAPPAGAPGPPGSELQRAMDIYHQELNRLQQNALAAAFKSAQNGKDQEDKAGSDSKENGADAKPPTSLSSQSSPSSAGKR